MGQRETKSSQGRRALCTLGLCRPSSMSQIERMNVGRFLLSSVGSVASRLSIQVLAPEVQLLDGRWLRWPMGDGVDGRGCDEEEPFGVFHLVIHIFTHLLSSDGFKPFCTPFASPCFPTSTSWNGRWFQPSRL